MLGSRGAGVDAPGGRDSGSGGSASGGGSSPAGQPGTGEMDLDDDIPF